MKIILPLFLTLLLTLITSSCSPIHFEPGTSGDQGSKIPISGTISYFNIVGKLEDPMSLSPVNNILPSNASISYTIEPEILPKGLSFEESTGLIYGNPQEESPPVSYTITASGTDKFENSLLSNDFTIRIDSKRLENPSKIISSEIHYTDKDGLVGERLIIEPGKNIIPINAIVEYHIEPDLTSGLYLGSGGVIFGIPREGGTNAYVVTMQANFPFVGTVDSNNFTISIPADKTIRGLTLVYKEDNTFSTTESAVIVPISNIPSDAKVIYSIRLANQLDSLISSTDLPASLIFDENTGKIVKEIGGISSEMWDEQYEVTATALKTGNYSGTVVSNKFTISINTIPIGDENYSIRYNDFVSNVDTEIVINLRPDSSTIPSLYTMNYFVSLGTLPSGLTLNSHGNIVGTISTTVDVELEVTAVVSGGIYSGTFVSNTFNIKVLIL